MAEPAPAAEPAAAACGRAGAGGGRAGRGGAGAGGDTGAAASAEAIAPQAAVRRAAAGIPADGVVAGRRSGRRSAAAADLLESSGDADEDSFLEDIERTATELGRKRLDSGGSSASLLSTAAQVNAGLQRAAPGSCSDVHYAAQQEKSARKPPQPLEGRLHKLQPQGIKYQERTFRLEGGLMAYVGGDGESRAIDLRQVTKVEVRDAETLCFAVVTPERDYVFRARDSRRSTAGWPRSPSTAAT